MNPSHWSGNAVGRIDNPGLLGLGQVCSHGQRTPTVLFDFMRPQYLEGVFVVTMDDRADRLQRKLGVHRVDLHLTVAEFARIRVFVRSEVLRLQLRRYFEPVVVSILRCQAARVNVGRRRAGNEVKTPCRRIPRAAAIDQPR